jgi:hypothetical protein
MAWLKGCHNMNNEKKFMEIWIKRDIQLPQLAMIYQLNIEALLDSFSFLFFKHESQILASIHKDVAHVVNLNDPNMWIQTCE